MFLRMKKQMSASTPDTMPAVSSVNEPLLAPELSMEPTSSSREGDCDGTDEPGADAEAPITATNAAALAVESAEGHQSGRERGLFVAAGLGFLVRPEIAVQYESLLGRAVRLPLGRSKGWLEGCLDDARIG